MYIDDSGRGRVCNVSKSSPCAACVVSEGGAPRSAAAVRFISFSQIVPSNGCRQYFSARLKLEARHTFRYTVCTTATPGAAPEHEMTSAWAY